MATMCSGISDQFPVDHKEKWCNCLISSKMWNIKDLEGMFLPVTLLPCWSCICINVKWVPIPHYTYTLYLTTLHHNTEISSFFVISMVIDSDKRTLLEAFKKNQFTMKIEHVTCIWMFTYAMKFVCPKKWSFGLFRPNLLQLGLFHPYFLCNSIFRVTAIMKMVILDQSKPISLYCKIKRK